MNVKIGISAAPSSASQAAELLDPVLLALLEIIREGLLREGHVRLFNFGTFRIRWVREHRIKHPQSGKTLLVPVHPKVTFTPAQALRSLVDPDPRPVVPLAVARQPSQPGVPAQTVRAGATSDRASQVSDAMADALEADYAELNRPPKRLLALEHSKTWAALAAALPLILMALTADLNGRGVDVTALATDVSAAVATSDGHRQIPSPLASVLAAGADDTEVTLHGTHRTGDEPASPVPAVVTTEHNYFEGIEKYQVLAGDSLWGLAKQYYGDPMLWPLIYRANAAQMRHPDRLQREVLLTIPPLQRAAAQLSLLDRERTAQGYVMVYQYYRQRGVPNAYYFLIGARRYDAAWLRRQRDLVREIDRVHLG